MMNPCLALQAQLVQALDNSTRHSLKHLKLIGLSVRESDAQILVNAIPRTHLEAWSLDEGSLGPGGASALFRLTLDDGPTGSSPRMTSLTLDHVNLAARLRPGTVDLLATNRTLTDLTLHGRLGGNAVKLIASALKSNRTLVNLDLSHCNSACGFGALGEALAVSASLQRLNLNHSICTDSDVYQLAMGLRQNHSLTTLQIKSKSGAVTYENVQPLMETLKHYNTTLQHVDTSIELVDELLVLENLCRFDRALKSACLVLRGGRGALSPEQVGHLDQLERWGGRWGGSGHGLRRATLRKRWTPLLGSSRLRVKASLLFCWLSGQAEEAAKALRSMAEPPPLLEGTCDGLLDGMANGGVAIAP